MNNKITVLLTALLVVTLAVPVFADGHMEDDVKITGNVKTVFQVGGYGDNEGAAANLWADGDALDESYTADPDLFPAEKAFYQEIGFNVAATVNDNIDLDLDLNALTNEFTDTVGPVDTDTGSQLGNPGADNTLAMDTALLTITDGVSTIKIGDILGFHADYTFVDDEDREGVVLETKAMDADMSAFVLGTDTDDPDADTDDFYGVTATKELANSVVTGKVLHANHFTKTVMTNSGEQDIRFDITNVVAEIESDVTETVTANGKVVLNDWEAKIEDDVDDNDTFMSAGLSAAMSEALTVNANMEIVGEDVQLVADDTEGANTTLVSVDANYDLDDNNTVSGGYTMVDYDTDDDQSTIEAALNNTTGEYNNHASIELVTNDSGNDGVDTTVIKVGTEYAMDMATVSAELTNKSGDLNEFNYLTVGYDQQISDNITWNTSLGYIDGEDVLTGNDGDSTDFETALTVSF